MHPKQLSISDFTYDLPQERIAVYPLEKRDQSRLLVWQKGTLSETVYAGIAEQLPAGTLLVFNNTKVVEARLHFMKPGGSAIEVFCLEPGKQYADITTAMMQKGSVVWKCLVGGAKKWKEGLLECIVSGDAGPVTIYAEKLEKKTDHYLINLSWDDASLTFAEILHLAGEVPLPPYLNRDAEETDKERYQTIYAQHDGSVAAPTAGLHFTPAVFESLHAKGIAHSFVTLHVGAGTFKPVKAGTMQDHEMHAEFIDVSRETIVQLLEQSSGKVVAVGTTSLRTVESLYWLGVKIIAAPATAPTDLHLQQWEPYELPGNVSATEALNALLAWMDQSGRVRLLGKTQVIIAPGYQFRLASGLVTNFHQPQSTLLLLVAAIVGQNWKRLYDYAMKEGFRFLSYGDGCLLWV